MSKETLRLEFLKIYDAVTDANNIVQDDDEVPRNIVEAFDRFNEAFNTAYTELKIALEAE